MASTSTSLPALDAALAAIPAAFRKRLVQSYAELKAAWTSRQFDACGLRAGKFCEVLLRFLEEELTGKHTAFGTKLGNFSDICRHLERLPKSAGSESFRILIPRALNFIYTLRNKRDIGHVGGDVDANEIDASTAVRMVDWCLSEIIRIVHTLSLEEAQELLNAIAEREAVAVWAVAGKKRVLRLDLSRIEQTLVLLYSGPDTAVLAEDLASWLDAPRLSDFRRDILRSLHRRRLIEFDAATDTATLSPTGAEVAEAILRR